MIICRNIWKSYEHLDVLKGINLEIGTGEIVSIVGKSGAGKSTLLHIMGTLDIADKGELIINDNTVNSMNQKELAQFRNQEIGFIFQFHHLLPEFTALENVCMPAMIAGHSLKDYAKKGTELLAYLGIENRATHKPNQLSGGEQQRVAVARALINQPSVIFADEPSGNLDSASSNDLHELIFKLRADFGQTFVIVTHSDTLARLSDRVLLMEDGLILHDTYANKQ